VVRIESLIYEVLKNSGTFLTINEVAQKVNAHRTTTSKYLAVLEAKGMIRRRNVGKAKLYYVGNDIAEMKMVQV
jgi:Mn-dependent DtxR family transcriptional regulator